MSNVFDLTDSYIVFRLGAAAYGVASSLVRQIEMVESITPLPGAPNFVEGVVLSRGQMIPAVNLRVRLGLERARFDLKSRLIVAAVGSRTVGLVVDSAREFVHLPVGAIQPPPDTISGESGRYLQGIARVGDRLILILKIDEILKSIDSIPLAAAVAQEA